MGSRFPDKWSRERCSGSRDCLVSVLFGRPSPGGSKPSLPLFHRTMAAGRIWQVVLSTRSITRVREAGGRGSEAPLDDAVGSLTQAEAPE